MKLNVKAFALACGLSWGLGLFVLTWWLICLEGATGSTTPLGRVYLGYNISPLGSLIGLAWALVDGAIGGAVLGWLYNFFAARGSRPKDEP